MTTCAAVSRDAVEPLLGTAATARTWLLIEQPGPWGAKALTQSRLDPELGALLEATGLAAGVRVALIRRPGRTAERPGSARRVFLAHTAPGRSWIRTAVIEDPESLRELSLDRLGAGDHTGFGAPYTGEPLALVCTNGRRDRCCAVLGRPLAAELAASGDGEVWEITHIGGHRFSPTLLVLPYGYAYGRMSAPEVKQVLTDTRDGRITTVNCRGRSAWSRPAQAAELTIRHLTRETAEAAVSVPEVAEHGPDGWGVTVAHADGRRWSVRVEEDRTGPSVPGSCGAAPLAQTRMHVAHVAALARTPQPRPYA